MIDYEKIYPYKKFLENFRKKAAIKVGDPLPPMKRIELHRIDFNEMTIYNDYINRKFVIAALNRKDAERQFEYSCRKENPDIKVDVVGIEPAFGIVDMIETNYRRYLYETLKKEFEPDSPENMIVDGLKK